MQLITYWKRAVLGNYANFNGRDNRAEYWWFYLATIVVSIALSIVQLDAIGNLWSLAMIVPSIAAGTRRLHDTGRSGWWQLLVFTVIGVIPLIIFLASEGKPGANQYGGPTSGASGGTLPDPPLPPPPPPMPS